MLCQHCRATSMDVKWGISEEWLCPPCERRRAETKAKELQKKSQANHPNTRSHRSQSVAADPPAMCIPGCKSRKGKVAGDKLAHCCLCGHRFHTKCLNMKDDDVTTVWTCIACHGMPSNVREMNSKLNTLTSEVERVVILLNQTVRKSHQERDKAFAECSKLQIELARQRTKRHTVSGKCQTALWKSTHERNCI